MKYMVILLLVCSVQCRNGVNINTNVMNTEKMNEHEMVLQVSEDVGLYFENGTFYANEKAISDQINTIFEGRNIKVSEVKSNFQKTTTDVKTFSIMSATHFLKEQDLLSKLKPHIVSAYIKPKAEDSGM